MIKGVLLAREKEIDINSNLKKQEIHSDQAVVIKKILMNMPKNMIVTALAEFVGFKSKEDLKSAYYTEMIFGGVKLSWTRLDLVHCEKCGHFGHSVLECDAPTLPISKSSRLVKRVPSEDYHLSLAKLYARKSVPISKPAAFGGKFWAQVVLLASPSSGPHFDSGFGFGPLFSGSLSIKRSMLVVQNKSSINDCLALLEHFLELLANQIMNKFDEFRVFTFGLDVGFHGAKITIIMNNSLARHVLKVDEIPGHLISVHFLFKNKLSVMILGLYTTADINSMVSKVVNSSSFVVLGGDFNENGSVKKMIDFILVNENLAFAMALHFVDDISDFFNTNHKSVSILIGLDELLDTHLISIHRQLSFKDCFFAMLLARSDMFEEARINELFIVKVVKCWNSGDLLNFNCLIKIWSAIDVVKASKVNGMVLNSVSSMELIKHLLVIRKKYCKSKYCESKIAKNTAIRNTIDYCMENFCFNKEKIIKSILEHSFPKVVLNHLVVDDELVIEHNKVKLKLSRIPNKLWKHCGVEVLVCLLKLLNLCLSMDAVSDLPIVLVKTAHKILSKILFDWISLACNKFNVLCGNNFLVLKDTSTQSPIFAIGSVVENALEKNRELWLDWINKVMINFELLDSYRVHDGLDQGEHWKQLDPRGPVPYWFSLTSDFMNNSIFLGVGAATATKENVLSVLNSDKFSEVCDNLLKVWSDCIKIYTDGSLKYTGSVEVTGGAAAYFLAANAGIGVKVTGLLFSTLTELQAVVLALECVLFSCSMVLYLDSQSVIDAVYKQLPVAVRKRLYNKGYPGVLCLLYGKVKFSDHVFACFGNSGLCRDILVETAKK
ncbi:hypothetical protein G9A89_008745 [Geosiphon pyriformis]|nr:hypothetical protein G9A89_008745 [Geosiphon pyriformis]